MFFHNKDTNIALRYSFNFLGNFVYQIQIPINYYKLVFSEIENMCRFDELFKPKEFLIFSECGHFALITFDALNSAHRKSDALPRWFRWLNIGPENFLEPTRPAEYQISLINFPGTSVALSFIHWTWYEFNDSNFRKKIIDNITEKINLFSDECFEKKRLPLIPQYTFDETFMIYMYSNGLWLAGSYGDITTHNCDTKFQQFRFIVAIMEIIKELQKRKPVIS